MSTTILGPMPPEVEELIRRRHELGQDLYDEVWEGDYHMVPGPHPHHGDVQGQVLALLREPVQQKGLRLIGGPFNIGEKDDFRVPDGGAVVPPADQTFLPTAVLVVEVLSPDDKRDDETYAKFAFYHRHRVQWILVADPAARSVELYARDPAHYRPVDEIPGVVRRAELQPAIQWP